MNEPNPKPPEPEAPRLPSSRRWRRRLFIAALLSIGGLLVVDLVVIDRLGGASSRPPSALAAEASPEARALIAAAFEGVPSGTAMDYHTHLAGLGTDADGCSINPHMLSWMHPLSRLKFKVYVSGYGVTDLERADQQIRERLIDLIENIDGHGRYALLAFDRNHDADGRPVPEDTEFYVPNAVVFKAAEKAPELFAPVMSIHPYRPDAVEVLERFSKRGGRLVKWLPNAMGIDPASPKCEPFYLAMKRLGVALLSHAGEEQAVDAEEAQKLGNPLRLRAALDRGVKVIIAHCASLGQSEDLDDPARPKVPSFSLFLRLMGEDRYRGLLFGEISATTQFNRLGVLPTLLERSELHDRLVNGSDYPLPAINIVIRTSSLQTAGLISAEERKALNEIYDFNPLLFDFVLKRTLKHPKTGARFPARIFREHPELKLR